MGRTCWNIQEIISAQRQAFPLAALQQYRLLQPSFQNVSGGSAKTFVSADINAPAEPDTPQPEQESQTSPMA